MVRRFQDPSIARAMTALALALLAIPFAFGVVRLAITASDWRYLVVATASTLSAVLIQRRSARGGAATRFGAALVGAGLSAALAAVAVGARSLISVGVVALGFALCSASGAWLLVRARND